MCDKGITLHYSLWLFLDHMLSIPFSFFPFLSTLISIPFPEHIVPFLLLFLIPFPVITLSLIYPYICPFVPLGLSLIFNPNHVLFLNNLVRVTVHPASVTSRANVCVHLFNLTKLHLSPSSLQASSAHVLNRFQCL